ncbi:ABC transporter permease [Mucilaginibacter sp. PPCGB 2223]|uniref:ABC transporter permease n=1 Tax=Mucilaginibacter sp. PPCGB 2223 TaxID=1886027 RepID=UPI0021111330|nr:ABC transporter permease [Mucilaginibacter sp. PPCGB 2223]
MLKYKNKNFCRLNFASFIASRISFRSKRTFSKLIVRIAITGIMLGLSVMILSVAIVKGFKKEVGDRIQAFAGDIRISKVDLNASFENTPFNDNDTLVKRLLADKQITKVMPFATKNGIIKAKDEIEAIIMKGVDRSYDWSFLKQRLTTGRVIDFSDTTESKQEILISQYTADRLKLKLGDKFVMYFIQQPLKKRPFKIVGIFDMGVEEVDKTFAIGDLALIRRLDDWHKNQIGGYEVRTRYFENIEQAAASANNVLPPDLKAFTITETYASIFEWLKLLDVNTQVILVLMLAVAVINMISALLIMILERTSMIGMIKAMGATNMAIQEIFMINAFYLIGLGMILGNLLGLGVCILQYQTHLFKLDQASYYMTFVPISINWLDVVLINAGTLFVCLLVLIVPSMLVTRISPVKAIRFK